MVMLGIEGVSPVSLEARYFFRQELLAHRSRISNNETQEHAESKQAKQSFLDWKFIWMLLIARKNP